MKGFYGWQPDRPDQRDKLYGAPSFEELQQLPPYADLTEGMPPVYDQSQLSACTSNAIAAAIEYEAMRQKLLAFVPSRLFIYYEERRMEGTVNYDSGARIRDGMKVVHKFGYTSEGDWPYDIDRFREKPPAKAYSDARRNLATNYFRIPQMNAAMRLCLAKGYPFVFGFTVYDSFESDEVALSGIAPMPGPNEQPISGHAVLAVGYNDRTRRFKTRNSWGTNWGQQGYFEIPYDYLTNRGLASDFWTIRQVQES